MNTFIIVPSIVVGMLIAFLAFVAGAGTILSFFTENQPLILRIGEYGITSATSFGKVAGAAVAALLFLFAHVFLVLLPDKFHGNRKR